MHRSAEPFVHILLFECHECGCPVPAALTSDRKSMEDIDARAIRVSCRCGWVEQVSGTEARRHWVDDWPVRPQSTGSARTES